MCKYREDTRDMQNFVLIFSFEESYLVHTDRCLSLSWLSFKCANSGKTTEIHIMSLVFHLVFHTLVLISMDCNSIHTTVNDECLFSYSSKRKEHGSSSYLPKLRTTFLPLLMHLVWNDYKLVQKWSINQHCGSRSWRYSWWCGGIQGRESISPMDQQSWNSNLCEPFVWGC